MNLELRRPDRDLIASFIEMRDACLAAGEDHWHPGEGPPFANLAHSDAAAYVDLINGWSKGDRLPKGWAWRDAFWIVSDGIVVGEVGIRQWLTDNLRQVGGHIGYHVHPRYRNRGIATFALREALRLEVASVS
jgi:predicted acetyltransferase